MNKIHFIGIKGVGMTALAIHAKEKGYQVTGSDSGESFITDNILEKAKIKPSEFSPKNLQSKPDYVVVSAAYDKENIEVKEAKKKHIEIKSYSEALRDFTSDSKVIAVSGIHGKTTTTALISHIFSKAGLDPSFIIGSGGTSSFEFPGHAGKGEYFIVEADEYRKSPDDSTPKFFDLNPEAEVITSIEMDHPDIFSSEENVYNVFYKFACRVPREGFIVLCNDYPKSRKLNRSLVDRNILTYGFQLGSDWQITNYKEEKTQTTFSLKNGNKLYPFKIKIPGRANVLNATAAMIVALKFDIDIKIIKRSLEGFKGVKRRFETIGSIDNNIIVDDYAHHPRSIDYLLETTKAKYPDYKIWCIFQPHTYSRTKNLLREFSRCFRFADKVIITDIFTSAREKDATISGKDLVDEIRKNRRNVKYISDWRKIIEEIIQKNKDKNLILVVGAGDIYKLGNQIIKELKQK